MIEDSCMKNIGNSQRIITPEKTLKLFSQKACICGITRIADISSLDITCLPVATAIRPMAKTLQVSNGKGLTIEAAKVSAMMEGIELYHAESNKGLEIHKRSIEQCKNDPAYYMPNNIMGINGNTNWLPATNYDREGSQDIFISEMNVLMFNSYIMNTSNGLASGNCYEEAVIHGIYELIERDAIVQSRRSTKSIFMNLKTVKDSDARKYIERIIETGSEIYCKRLMHSSGLYIFEVFLINMSMPNQLTAITKGYGCHQDINVALLRGVTEAIQSRTTAIHATREDVVKLKNIYRSHPTLDDSLMNTLEKMNQIKKNSFDTIENSVKEQQNIREIMESLLEVINKKMGRPCYVVNLYREEIGVPVVKCIIPEISGIDNLEEMRWNY